MSAKSGATAGSGGDARAPAARGAAARGRGTIGRKVLALAGAWVTAGFVALLALQIHDQYATRDHDMRASGRAVARLVAAQAAGGVRWGKPKAIEAAYADLAADPDGNLTSVAVFDAAGGTLTRHHRSGSGPDLDLGTLLPGAEAELAAGRIFEREVEGDRLVMMVPVLSGEERQRVGTLALAWSTARLGAGDPLAGAARGGAGGGGAGSTPGLPGGGARAHGVRPASRDDGGHEPARRGRHRARGAGARPPRRDRRHGRRGAGLQG
jgi:hypothetical protein